jgi:uncharacterized membrane protein (UPF0127 family)
MNIKNNKKLWVGGVLLVVIVVIVLYAVFGFFRPTVSDYGLPTAEISIGKNNPVIVEIADSDASRAKGLMMRTFLPQGQGMLFVWPEEAPRTMWMKDTFISLDMIFIDAQGNIVGIVTDAAPHDLSPLGTDRPARYVLEVPAGDAKRLGLAVGQTLDLP